MARRLAPIVPALLALALPAAAGPLAPRRPSELALLSTSSSTAGCGATEFRVDTLRDPATGSVPLLFPPRRVLVITSIDFWGAGASGSRYRYSLVVAGQGGLVVADAGVADASGNLVGSVATGSGVVVRADDVLCSTFQHNIAADSGAFAHIHGFFAKDR